MQILPSVFHKEYGVTVFANDLWISATENLARFEEANVSEMVFSIHAEAHALPYAEGIFDVAISSGQFDIVVLGLIKKVTEFMGKDQHFRDNCLL